MKKDTHIILGICIVFLCAAAFMFYRGQEKTVSTEEFTVSEDSLTEGILTEEAANRKAFSEKGQKTEGAAGSTSSPETVEECAVSVLGAVKHPGIFRYHGNARIYDAIKARGGFKKNAAKDSVNLAKPLTDGEQIQVLTKKQMRQQKSRMADEVSAAGNSEPDSGNALLNINKATKEELMELPGIGEAKALLIINYRTEHGSFHTPEELMNISGIKEGIYNKIKAWITTG
ncbi:MAG: helix-hairpin-helix domain-containing protein [Lachnospiraceae bacterium]|nr:helix-hairpin-helix domain-containing protein [Lachnospiraceae bacterium]